MSIQKKELASYEWVKTDDGSLTLFSSLYGENCHSTSGARAETIFHYIKGCQVEDIYQASENFTLLEVGLGTGMGLELTIDALEKYPLRPTELISTEIDNNLVEFIVNSGSIFSDLKLSHINDVIFYQGQYKSFTITILVGDARKTVPNYFKTKNLKTDVIYQDAFSPRKNPDLWTVEWFRELKLISKNHVKMSTYSASSSIRKSMIEAGWKLTPGMQFGTKKDSTRASLLGETESSIFDRLARSPVPALIDSAIEEFKLGKLNVKK